METIVKSSADKKVSVKNTNTKVKKEESKKVSLNPNIVDVLTPFIAEKKYNRQQLTEIATEKCKHLAMSSISTTLTDCKNPRYNRFANLVMVDKEGVYYFSKKVA